MKGEKLTKQAFHPCFIYNSYCQACQEQAAGRLSLSKNFDRLSRGIGSP